MSREVIGSASSISTAIVGVPGGSSAVKLVDARQGRKSVILHLSNAGTATTFFIGNNSSVSSADGFHMYLSDYLEIQTESEIWGVWPTGSGTLGVSVMEVYD